MPDDAQTKKVSQFSAGDEEDLELVARAVDGDYEAFERIVERYQEKGYRLAWSMVKDDDVAADVVQDAFLNVYRKLDTFKGDSKFSSWIYRVVVNAALMKLRKQKRRSEVQLEALSPAFLDSGHHAAPISQWRPRADEAALNHELREKIIEAVDELEPKYQSVFVLKEVEGLSLQEIGEVMELSYAAVRTLLCRARGEMRRALAAEGFAR